MEKYRVEIISNQSVEEDIIELLEETIPDLEYTLLPTVHGKGRRSKKLGTSTWPEQNFLFFCYVEKPVAQKIKKVVEEVQLKFPREGISFFCVQEVEL